MFQYLVTQHTRARARTHTLLLSRMFSDLFVLYLAGTLESLSTLRASLTSNEGLQSFLAGGLCSVGAWAIVFPLDTIKAQIQASPLSSPVSPVCKGAGKSLKNLGGAKAESSRGIVAQIQRVYAADGFIGFYRGLGAGLARPLVANGVGFMAFDWVVRQME